LGNHGKPYTASYCKKILTCYAQDYPQVCDVILLTTRQLLRPTKPHINLVIAKNETMDYNLGLKEPSP